MVPENMDRQRVYNSCLERVLQMRYVVVLLLFISMFLSITIQWTISYAIVAMAAPLDDTTAGEGSKEYECPNHVNNGTSSQKVGTLRWSQQTQTLLLNAGMWGYLCSQIPMGLLAEVMDNKFMISVSLFGASVLSALVPVVAVWNVEVLIALQVVLGIIAGANFPPCFCLLSRWVADEERSTMTAIYLNGIMVSSILAPLLVTYLCEFGFAGGWPSSFYVNSIMGGIWLILWHVLVTNNPEDNPYIREKEQKYIVEKRLAGSKKEFDLPWKKLLMSCPIWSLFAGCFSISWPQILILNELPFYMSSQLKLSVEEVGYLGTAINAGSALMLLLSGVVADILRSRRMVSTTALRKIFSTFGGVTTTVCIALIPTAGCSKTVVTIVALLCVGGIAIDLNALGTASMEVAPKYIGTVGALWNFFGSIPSPPLTWVISLETDAQANLYTWGKVYYIGAGVTIVGTLLFLVFGSAEPQPWATMAECQQTPEVHSQSNGQNNNANVLQQSKLE